jgi:hypothetical protein
MPFKKEGPGDYVGPSGKHFNLAQVRLYYAGGGKFPGQKGEGKMKKYAEGGGVDDNEKPKEPFKVEIPPLTPGAMEPSEKTRFGPSDPKVQAEEVKRTFHPRENYAKGGAVHGDEAEDRKLFGKMIKEYESREDAKGKGPKTASYAAGGAVLAHSGDFFKTPDTFRTDKQKQDYSNKGGEKTQAKEKSEVKQNRPRG